jgi:diguanylate cyclase (GGDEF)-like protein
VSSEGPVPTDLVFIIVSIIVAALLLIGGAVAGLRERGRLHERMAEPPSSPAGKYDVDEAMGEKGMLGVGPTAGGAVRILWWVTLAAVLVGVGLSGSFSENRTSIFAVGGIAVVVVLALHELLPMGWRTPVTSWLEVLIAFALSGGLLLLTGYGASPFVFTLDLIAVAVALSGSGWGAAGAALLGTGVYLGVVASDPGANRFSDTNLLSIALSLASLWFLVFLAAVFAGNERRIRAMLSRLSRIDALTGLLNRGQLYETLEQEVRRTRRSERGFSLLMMDLDGLKAVNDGLGHQRGDEVLRSLGRVIREDIRKVDSAYRYGGDEFLVLLPETDFAGAFVVAEKIRADAEEIGQRLESEGVVTSVSIGLVSHPQDGGTADELVRAADRAMYNAKSLGKNQISGFPRPNRMPPQQPFEPPQQPFEPPPTPPSPAGIADGGDAPIPSSGASAAPPPTPPLATSPEAPTELAAVAVTEEWVAVREPEAPVLAAVIAGSGDEEPDAAEVRRRIAVASRSFDTDDHVLAALDAILSPPSRAAAPRRPD